MHSSIFVLFTNYLNRKNQYAEIYTTTWSREELMTTDHNFTAIIWRTMWNRLKSISFSRTHYSLYSPRLAHIAKVSCSSDSRNFVSHNTDIFAAHTATRPTHWATVLASFAIYTAEPEWARNREYYALDKRSFTGYSGQLTYQCGLKSSFGFVESFPIENCKMIKSHFLAIFRLSWQICFFTLKVRPHYAARLLLMGPTICRSNF